jgi:hypothetical protein
MFIYTPTKSYSRRRIFPFPLALALASNSKAFSISSALAKTQGLNTDLANDVATFVKFGHHRVGTQVDRDTAGWLKSRLEQLGFVTQLDRFPVKTLLSPEAVLRANNLTIEAFPQWLPPKASLGTKLTAPFLPLESISEFNTSKPSIRFVPKAIAFTANWIPKLDALVHEAKSKGAIALIIAIDSSSKGMFVCNQHSQDHLPIPVVLVAPSDLTKLAAIPENQPSNGELTINGQPATAEGINVIGEKPGVGQKLVLSTPLTGWFHCGAERGPGIALWLRMAALLTTIKNPVVMLGTGSHEVGHLGMEHALTHGAPRPDEVALWVHFGASLGATKLDAQFNTKSAQALVGTKISEIKAKAALGSLLPLYVNGQPSTLGEAGQVIGAGHERFIGMSGIFPGFHTPEDLGQAIDYATLERIAQASAEMILNGL